MPSEPEAGSTGESSPPPRFDAPGMTGLRGAAGQRQERHRSDARQRLAAEAEASHALEILEGEKFAGGVPLQRHDQFLRSDPGAVVYYFEQLDAACVQLYFDRAGASVQAVLEHLLECRRWTLDDLAGGDLVDKELGQNLDGWHRGLRQWSIIRSTARVAWTSTSNFHQRSQYWCASRMSPIIRRTLFSAAVPKTNARLP